MQKYRILDFVLQIYWINFFIIQFFSIFDIKSHNCHIKSGDFHYSPIYLPIHLVRLLITAQNARICNR